MKRSHAVVLLFLWVVFSGLARAQTYQWIYPGKFNVDQIEMSSSGKLAGTLFITNTKPEKPEGKRTFQVKLGDTILDVQSILPGETGKFDLTAETDCLNTSCTLTVTPINPKNGTGDGADTKISVPVKQAQPAFLEDFTSVTYGVLVVAFVGTLIAAVNAFGDRKLKRGDYMQMPEWDPSKSTALNLTLGVNVLSTLTGLTLFHDQLGLNFLVYVGLFSVIQAMVPLVVAIASRPHEDEPDTQEMPAQVYMWVVFLTLICSLGALAIARSLLLQYVGSFQFSLIYLNGFIVLVMVVIIWYAVKSSKDNIEIGKNNLLPKAKAKDDDALVASLLDVFASMLALFQSKDTAVDKPLETKTAVGHLVDKIKITHGKTTGDFAEKLAREATNEYLSVNDEVVGQKKATTEILNNLRNVIKGFGDDRHARNLALKSGGIAKAPHLL